MQILAITNQKGGVGKTTTAINLASALTLESQRVLLIDMDPQGNASSGVGLHKSSINNGIASVLMGYIPLSEAIHSCPSLPNLDVIPASLDLIGLPVELANVPRQNFRLKDALQNSNRDYDYVLIDCPSSLDLLTINALAAANSVIVPLQAEYFALEGINDLLRTIQHVRKGLNSGLEIAGVIMTMVNMKTRLGKEIVMQAQNFFGPTVIFESMIHRSIQLGEAPSHAEPIHIYDPNAVGSLNYTAAAKELLFRDGRISTPDYRKFKSKINLDANKEEQVETNVKKLKRFG